MSLPVRSTARGLTSSKLRALLGSSLISPSWVLSTEDDYDDVFVAEAFFNGGPYLVPQGLADRSVHNLNVLMRSTFRPEGEALPASFLSEADALLTLLLRLSDIMSRRAGLARNQVTPRPGRNAPPDVPATDLMVDFAGYTTFDLTQLRQRLTTNQMAWISTLAEGPARSLGNITTMPFDDELVVRPMLLYGHALVVANPVELASSARHHLIVLAQEHDCVAALARRYRDEVFQAAKDLVQMNGAAARGARRELVEDGLEQWFDTPDDLTIQLVLYADQLKDYKEQEPFGTWPCDALSAPLAAAWTTPPPGVASRCLRLAVVQGIGRTSALMLAGKGVDDPILVLTLDDLTVITHQPDHARLGLWYFAFADSALHRTTQVRSFSALDNYALYRSNDCSYYLDDDEPLPYLRVWPGSGRPLRELAAARVDEHQVRLPGETSLVPVLAVYGSDVAPIYLVHPGYRDDVFVVESDTGPIAVRPESVDLPGLSSFLHVIAEAVAYWIWQLQLHAPDVARSLRSQGTVTIRFDDTACWATALRSSGESLSGLTQTPFATWFAGEQPHLLLNSRGAGHLAAPANHADRHLVQALLEAALATEDCIPDEERGREVTNAILERVAPLGHKRMIQALDPTKVMLRNLGSTRARVLQQPASAAVLDDGGRWLQTSPWTAGRVADNQRTALLRDLVGHHYRALEREIAGLDCTVLLPFLIAQDEALIHSQEERRHLLASNLACFGPHSRVVRDMTSQQQRSPQTAIASRFLIEYVAARPPLGSGHVDLLLYDQLIARAAEILDRATLSDAIHNNFSDVELSNLPSGRLGVSRGDRYSQATIDLADKQTTAAQTAALASAPDDKTQAQPPDTAVETAMLAEFGFTLHELALLAGDLIGIADELRLDPQTENRRQGPHGPVQALREDVVEQLTRGLEWSEAKVTTALGHLTLDPRPDYLKPHEQVLPWRYNRNLSYLRRPLIKTDSEQGPMLTWAVGRVWLTGAYWMSSVYSGRLQASSPEMKSLLGRIRQSASRDFERRVEQTLHQAGFPYTANGVKRLAGQRMIDTEGKDLGDIDALAVHLGSRIIVLVEAKDFELARTPVEMANEANDLLRGDKSAVAKSLRRAAWVRAHLPLVLKHFNIAAEVCGWTVLPAVVTSIDLLTPALLHSELPVMPVSDLEDWAHKAYASPSRRRKPKRNGRSGRKERRQGG